MKIFKAGDKARIIDMPEEDKHLIGEEVTVIPAGGFGIETDDVCVRTVTGRKCCISEKASLG